MPATTFDAHKMIRHRSTVSRPCTSPPAGIPNRVEHDVRTAAATAGRPPVRIRTRFTASSSGPPSGLGNEAQPDTPHRAPSEQSTTLPDAIAIRLDAAEASPGSPLNSGTRPSADPVTTRGRYAEQAKTQFRAGVSSLSRTGRVGLSLRNSPPTEALADLGARRQRRAPPIAVGGRLAMRGLA
jgi:hypothetical protein